MSNRNDVAVIGCGVLGTSLCKQLLESPDFASRTITGITKTSNRHESILKQVGDNERFALKTADEIQGQTFRDVVFCAPPSGFDDYPEAVRDAVTNIWDKSSDGVFVFTSSGGIYGSGADGEVVNEDSPTADPETNPRAGKLIRAEEACLANGGCCLRLAGLYSLERGAHNYWLTSGNDVNGRADGIINLLHYDDAAGACVAALKAGPEKTKGKVFLISDGNPTTRKGICESAKKAKLYATAKMPSFVGSESDAKGKIYDGSATNAALNWKSKYVSFDEYMASQS
jgi:nucleoside-diphosphate-sugar epimerase